MGQDEEAREIEEFEEDLQVAQMAWHNQCLAMVIEANYDPWLSDTLLFSTKINQSGLMDISLVEQLPYVGPDEQMRNCAADQVMFLHMKPVPGSDTVAPGSLLSICHADGEIQNIPLFKTVSCKLTY